MSSSMMKQMAKAAAKGQVKKTTKKRSSSTSVKKSRSTHHNPGTVARVHQRQDFKKYEEGKHERFFKKAPMKLYVRELLHNLAHSAHFKMTARKLPSGNMGPGATIVLLHATERALSALFATAERMARHGRGYSRKKNHTPAVRLIARDIHMAMSDVLHQIGNSTFRADVKSALHTVEPSGRFGGKGEEPSSDNKLRTGGSRDRNFLSKYINGAFKSAEIVNLAKRTGVAQVSRVDNKDRGIVAYSRLFAASFVEAVISVAAKHMASRSRSTIKITDIEFALSSYGIGVVGAAHN